MFVVDADTLGLVNLLHFVHQVPLQFVFAADMENIVGVQRAADEGVSRFDLISVGHQSMGGSRNDALSLFHVLPDYGNATGAQLYTAADVRYHLLMRLWVLLL